MDTYLEIELLRLRKMASAGCDNFSFYPSHKLMRRTQPEEIELRYLVTV